MAITTNIFANGIDVGSIFGAKGASTAAATHRTVNGTDLNALLLARADGIDCGFNTNILVGGTDLRSIFGAPAGNTPLPINGGSYQASANSGTSASVANLVFSLNNSGWQLTRTVSPNSGSGTIASGSNPSGAVNVQFVLTITSSTTSTSSSNAAPTSTAIGAGVLSASVQANGTPSTPERQIIATLQINYFNSSGTNISQTNISLNANATGSS